MPGWYDITKLGRDVRRSFSFKASKPILDMNSPSNHHNTKTKQQLDYEESIRNQDERGILRSREYFQTLIKEQMDIGIKASRIVIGGFSQGGAMAVFSGITNKESLGGVFGLSCYLLLSDKIKNYIPEEFPNKKTPFFLAHGTDDSIVRHDFGAMSASKIKELGFEDVTFKSYA